MQRKTFDLFRDAILFFAGLGGVYHEAIRSSATERPTLLILFAAMMGLPAFLRTDVERRAKKTLESDELVERLKQLEPGDSEEDDDEEPPPKKPPAPRRRKKTS